MDKRIQNIGLFVLLPAGDPRIFSVSETWQIEILFFDFIAVRLFVLGQGAGGHFSALDAAYLLVGRLRFPKSDDYQDYRFTHFILESMRTSAAEYGMIRTP